MAAPALDRRPQPLPPTAKVELQARLSYRIKNRLLGRPRNTDQLDHERLGKPTALATFASDNLSSAAYATEEILHTLLAVGAVGLVAFDYVLPITVAMIAVLGVLVLSYRQTIRAYPSAGGAYIVTKDNLGVLPAQVAGVALLIGYILTVAVSVSAAASALYSMVDGAYPYRIPIALFFILLIAFGNMRGVKESGKIFAVPTYTFMVAMALMIGYGVLRSITGDLDEVVPDQEQAHELVVGGSIGWFLILQAFASGGAAVTGVEAISNGVPAFKEPSWKNARTTLVIMGSILGVMFLGISWLASQVRPVPVEGKTVVAQIAEAVYGNAGFGQVMFGFTLVATMLILVMAANTSYADFPRLASFQAEDSFMPRQLTKRGHRLVFSNGIIALSIASAALVLAFGADVNRLIPLYAIGVFTSFTLAQLGMLRHHIRLKEPKWRTGVLINGTGALVTFVVTLVVGVTQFPKGAWMVIVAVPILVWLIVRLNRQYEAERSELMTDAELAATAPILRRHTVLVLIDRIDRTAARAIQYARALTPDELRAVHIAVDQVHADELAEQWSRLALARLPLEIRECPDRYIDRSVLELVAETAADGQTEVSILIPRREYRSAWHRFLHDRTGDSIAKAIGDIPHANVTFVPYHLTQSGPGPVVRPIEEGAALARRPGGTGAAERPGGPGPH